MDFSIIFQLRTKKFWWMDVIFYFVISLLIATLLCYVIFLIKDSMLRGDIKTEAAALLTVGTDSQKVQEKDVIKYQKEIGDFNSLFKNHEFASNVFAFMQTQTLPNIWFKQFSLDEKGGTIQLSGEADNMDAFSRQTDAFEKNKYVANLSALNSSLGNSARVEFNINLTLSRDIFSYLSDMAAVLQPPTAPLPPNPTPPTAPPTQSAEKLITVFDLPLAPPVTGVVDETNYVVTLNVPFGTDIKNLTPAIVVSPNANVLPSSNTPQDFTGPVTYTVVAQDGSAQNYVVEVVVNPQIKAAKKSSQLLLIILVAAVLVVVAAVIVGAFLFIRRKKQTQNAN